MMGVDKMLASMIGLTPDQMKEKAIEFETFVKTIATGIVDMNDKLDKILQYHEELNGLHPISHNEGQANELGN